MRKLQKLAVAAVALTLIGSMSLGALAEDETEKAGQVKKTVQAGEQETEQSSETGVATAAEMVTPEEVVEDWMVPITADELNDGVYEIEVACSSSMFKIDKCELTVADGEMSAVMTMNGTGYLYLFMGTGEEAVKAEEEDYIPFVENEDGQHTYEVPVEALDAGIDCAAFSKRKEQWYDRTLVFLASSLPEGARKEQEMTTVEELALADGTYLIEATLEGGSGKTTVASPAKLTVENGEATAEIIFSSPYYDYVLLGEEKFEPVNEEGDSTFLLPVKGFDYQMAITADTIAMSTPHEIDYHLYLDSATIKEE